MSASLKADGLDAVLPIVPSDFERAARLLLPSLQRNIDFLGTLWMIVPQDSVRYARRRFKDATVVSEYDVVPQLRVVDRYRRLAVLGRLPVHPHRRPGRIVMGWYKQQLLKLTVASLIDAPFYVTLDADVISTRKASVEDFVVGGRGALRRDDSPRQLTWYRQSARALGLPESPDRMGVTPAIISSPAAKSLLDWVGGPRELILRLPWTEYAAYFTFLRAFGLVDAYHFWGELHSTPCRNGDPWELWKPNTVFSSSAPPFTFVQSNKGLDPEAVAERIRPFVDWL